MGAESSCLPFLGLPRVAWISAILSSNPSKPKISLCDCLCLTTHFIASSGLSSFDGPSSLLWILTTKDLALSLLIMVERRAASMARSDAEVRLDGDAASSFSVASSPSAGSSFSGTTRFLSWGAAPRANPPAVFLPAFIRPCIIAEAMAAQRDAVDASTAISARDSDGARTRDGLPQPAQPVAAPSPLTRRPGSNNHCVPLQRCDRRGPRCRSAGSCGRRANGSIPAG